MLCSFAWKRSTTASPAKINKHKLATQNYSKRLDNTEYLLINKLKFFFIFMFLSTENSIKEFHSEQLILNVNQASVELEPVSFTLNQWEYLNHWATTADIFYGLFYCFHWMKCIYVYQVNCSCLIICIHCCKVIHETFACGVGIACQDILVNGNC